jgi:hypothetical protein
MEWQLIWPVIMCVILKGHFGAAIWSMHIEKDIFEKIFLIFR